MLHIFPTRKETRQQVSGFTTLITLRSGVCDSKAVQMQSCIPSRPKPHLLVMRNKVCHFWVLACNLCLYVRT